MPPAPVDGLIHVAITAGKVTAAMDLDDEFLERNWIPAVGNQARHI
jgi:hypothetical protein